MSRRFKARFNLSEESPPNVFMQLRTLKEIMRLTHSVTWGFLFIAAWRYLPSKARARLEISRQEEHFFLRWFRYRAALIFTKIWFRKSSIRPAYSRSKRKRSLPLMFCSTPKLILHAPWSRGDNISHMNPCCGRRAKHILDGASQFPHFPVVHYRVRGSVY